MAIKLSDGEKLILLMLCELQEKLNIKSETDTKLVKEAIFSGNVWGLEWAMPGVFHRHEAKEEVRSETIDILDMWNFLETSYERFSDTEKERVKKEGQSADVRFYGFDGNGEAEYISVASFLIDYLDRFQHFKGRDLNAHIPTLDMHRRMYRVFEPIRGPSAAVGRLPKRRLR
ncbi:MAG TPA: YfbU family protein [Terriglobales bacterium]|nr:YfbU family protein [Terriglobales bacterium]